MSKMKKREPLIKMDQILQDKIDSMDYVDLEDRNAEEMYTPTKSKQLQFFDMVNEAIEEEEELGKRKGKLKRKKRKNTRTKSVVIDDNGNNPIAIALVLCFLFVLFIGVMGVIVF